jgi:hypothetical protein
MIQIALGRRIHLRRRTIQEQKKKNYQVSKPVPSKLAGKQTKKKNLHKSQSGKGLYSADKKEKLKC